MKDPKDKTTPDLFMSASVFSRNGLREGRERRDRGMRIVIDADTTAWRDLCRVLCERFIDNLSIGTEFTGESVRLYCKTCGLGEPHHPNAWSSMLGSAIRRWRKAETVRVVGLGQAHDPRSHACSMPRYRKER